ncbi:50S ribosomal protein L7/L12 [Campylobacter sputorum subsp. bubulus]|nr:50S ribosomal protein L7/L12 [Campylobacter sputorum subsp. bubulus]
MAVTKEDVLEFISGLSVLELSELVKEFEEKFGVSAAPVVMAGGAAAGGAAAAEEKTEFDVILTDAGDKKLMLLKLLELLLVLDLKRLKMQQKILLQQLKKVSARLMLKRLKNSLKKLVLRLNLNNMWKGFVSLPKYDANFWLNAFLSNKYQEVVAC